MINNSDFNETYSDFSNEDMCEILNIFLCDYKNRMETIKKSIIDNDWETLENQSHRLKGSIAMFFDEEARQAANNLELSCSKKDRKESEALYIKFQKDADTLFEALSKKREILEPDCL